MILDGVANRAICNANLGRFARFDSQKDPYFDDVSSIRKQGVQFGNPATIRANQATRESANQTI